MYREWCKRNSPFLFKPAGSSSSVFGSDETPSQQPPERLHDGKRPAPFFKAVLVGPGGVGKTCLQRALRHLPFQEQQQTHGMELLDISLPACRLAQQETEVTLRVLDTGGQITYQFLKPLVMRDRAVVLMCFSGRRDRRTVHELQEDLDTLSALMDGGVVILVATQLDDMGVSPGQLSDSLEALCASAPQLAALRAAWDADIAPMCSRFRGALRVDARFLVVSSKEGYESTVDLLRARIRENIEQVFSYSSFFCRSLSDLPSANFFFLRSSSTRTTCSAPRTLSSPDASARWLTPSSGSRTSESSPLAADSTSTTGMSASASHSRWSSLARFLPPQLYTFINDTRHARSGPPRAASRSSRITL